MRTTFLSMAAATVAVASVSGCRSSSEGGAEGAAQDTVAVEAAEDAAVPADEAPPPAGGSAELDGTSWRLVSFGPDEPLAEGIEITAEFAEGQMAGRSACNRYTGPVEIDAAASTLKPGAFVSTKMACPPPQMENETRFLGALESVTGFEVAGDRLTLLGAEGATLVFERAARTP